MTERPMWESMTREQLRDEAVRQARIANGAMAEADALREQLRGVGTDAGSASMQAAFWRARAIELGATEDEWRQYTAKLTP